jgi:hypothetical protein
MATQQSLTVKCDSTPLLLFINLFNRALKVSKRSVDLGHFPFELFRVENDFCATRAGEVLVTLYPSDCFLRFAATIFAGEFDLSAVEDVAHE